MSNIDEKAKNNFTIEMRIFEKYEKVKYEIIKVIDFLRHAETNLGMCRIFDNHELWHSVIKPWFQPERFGITHLWFLCVLCGHVWCGISWHSLNAKASKVVVLKGEYGYVKFNIQK